MKFRVSGCYWSKGQFRNRGINMLGLFLPSLRECLFFGLLVFGYAVRLSARRRHKRYGVQLGDDQLCSQWRRARRK